MERLSLNRPSSRQPWRAEPRRVAVRGGTDAAPDGAAHQLLRLQRTAGNAAVQRLVRLTRPPAGPATLRRPERRAFVRSAFSKPRDRREGGQVIEDLAAATDVMDYANPAELTDDLVKRVIMTEVTKDSQSPDRKGRTAFGYPFTGSSLYWGPRVGFAAKDYWVPPTPDNYSLRTDPAKRRQLRELPRGQRASVFGDQSDYEFRLSPAGVADPYEAIMTLFQPQGPHKRTLIHCDYLVSLVHFRALMGTMGKAAFNSRITTYGPHLIVLRWDLFTELLPTIVVSSTSTRGGLGSIRKMTPSSPADLVIGDHVIFFNHPAYDLINDNVGNAWRLENAVLIARRGGDTFLGHGSGRKTDLQMRQKLAEEYNDVARIALRLVQQTKRGNPAARAAARTELATRFAPVVEITPGVWHVRGKGMLDVDVDIPLKQLRASDMPGLFDPRNRTVLHPIKRPVESG